MKIRFGISISDHELLTKLPALPEIQLLEVPGDVCIEANFSLPVPWQHKALWIRNSEDIRFFRTLPDAGMGVKQEFYRLFTRRCQQAAVLNCQSGSLAPDLDNAFDDPEYAAKLRTALGACFGIAEKYRLPQTLEVRIPGTAAETPDAFLRFKRSIIYPLRTMCVLHPHEPGALEAMAKFAGVCRFDCDIFRICFDAASGNYLSRNLFTRLQQFIRQSGFAAPVVIFDPGSGADVNAYAELNRLTESVK